MTATCHERRHARPHQRPRPESSAEQITPGNVPLRETTSSENFRLRLDKTSRESVEEAFNSSPAVRGRVAVILNDSICLLFAFERDHLPRRENRCPRHLMGTLE